MTDWTQRIGEAAVAFGTELDDDVARYREIKALMNEYAIERLEELKGKAEIVTDNEVQFYDYYAVTVEDIEAMQRSLKGGEL